MLLYRFDSGLKLQSRLYRQPPRVLKEHLADRTPRKGWNNPTVQHPLTRGIIYASYCNAEYKCEAKYESNCKPQYMQLCYTNYKSLCRNKRCPAQYKCLIKGELAEAIMGAVFGAVLLVYLGINLFRRIRQSLQPVQ